MKENQRKMEEDERKWKNMNNNKTKWKKIDRQPEINRSKLVIPECWQTSRRSPGSLDPPNRMFSPVKLFIWNLWGCCSKRWQISWQDGGQCPQSHVCANLCGKIFAWHLPQEPVGNKKIVGCITPRVPDQNRKGPQPQENNNGKDPCWQQGCSYIRPSL